jgi:hypothetical protein
MGKNINTDKQAMQVSPKLSLVYAGRNDGYMGNFNWRLSTSINFLAQNLNRLGRLGEVEILVCDWGSQEPLHTVLSLSPAAQHITKFLIVPPDLAKSAQGDSDFGIVIAQNAAIRRCQGEFIGQVDSDIMLITELLTGLLDILDQGRKIGVSLNQAMIYTKRRHLPWRYVADSPSISELDWFIHKWGNFLPVERFWGFEFAGPGFMIMHRQLWEECRGYDERLIYRGWMEIDLGLRVRRKYPLINLQRIGLTAFHLEHFPSRRGNSLNRKYNPTDWNNAFCPNDENWGLRQHQLDIFAYPTAKNAIEVSAPSQPIRLTYPLVKHIIAVILKSLWYPFQFVIGRVILVTQRVWFHLRFIRDLVKGRPINQWQSIVQRWWLERKQRI